MYSGMISTHSASRKVRHRDSPSSVSCRQIQGQHIKLMNQRERAMQSLPRRLFAYLREAWTGIISGDEGKKIIH